MSAVTITISTPGRAIVADGRLVAGESADVSVVGGVASKLYLVDPGREVVAACESFVAGSESATGVLNLATVPLANLVADIPAGRAIPLQAILEDAAGDVIGYGLVAVVSAPMPDALDPLDDDYIYAKLSDLQAYLTRAEADTRYAPIGAATPIAPSTDPSAAGKPADAKATGDQLAGKATSAQGAKADAALPANGVTTSAGGDVKLPDGRHVRVNNGNTVVWYGPDGIYIWDDGGDLEQPPEHALFFPAASGDIAIKEDLRYALDAEPRDPDPQTGKYALDDRAANWIRPDGASVTLVFPAPISGRLRDFEVFVESQNSGTGNLSLYCEGYNSQDVLTLGNGGGAVPDIPLGAETVLYFSEVIEGHFLLKGEKFVGITL